MYTSKSWLRTNYQLITVIQITLIISLWSHVYKALHILESYQASIAKQPQSHDVVDYQLTWLKLAYNNIDNELLIKPANHVSYQL